MNSHRTSQYGWPKTTFFTDILNWICSDLLDRNVQLMEWNQAFRSYTPNKVTRQINRSRSTAREALLKDHNRRIHWLLLELIAHTTQIFCILDNDIAVSQVWLQGSYLHTDSHSTWTGFLQATNKNRTMMLTWKSDPATNLGVYFAPTFIPIGPLPLTLTFTHSFSNVI